MSYIIWPTAFSRDQPKIVSARGFHDVITPLVSVVIIASDALLTIMRVCSSACLFMISRETRTSSVKSWNRFLRI